MASRGSQSVGESTVLTRNPLSGEEEGRLLDSFLEWEKEREKTEKFLV